MQTVSTALWKAVSSIAPSCAITFGSRHTGRDRSGDAGRIQDRVDGPAIPLLMVGQGRRLADDVISEVRHVDNDAPRREH